MSIGNWGRWGEADETGAGNLLDPEALRRGMSAVRDGAVLSLAQPLGPSTPVPAARRAPARFMERTMGDYAHRQEPPEAFHFAEDTVMFSTHVGTHIDALSHTWAGDQLYNGHPAARVQAGRGAARCGAERLAPVATRGILLDFVAPGARTVEEEFRIGPDELELACSRAKVTIEAGDAVLLHTGWWDSHGHEPEIYFYRTPGLTPDGARWLAERDVALVGADNCAIEALPFPDGLVFPVHLVLIHQHGIPLLENLSLAALCDQGSTAFLFVAAPLPLEGSTGGPVNPLAIV